MTNNQSLFLDTSIQISRKGNDNNEIAKIDEFIKKYSFISTSSYSRLEFKQSYIQDLVYLHRNLSLENSFANILFKIKGLTVDSGHKRKLSNILNALGGFFTPSKEFYTGSKDDKDLAEKITLYLETIIEDSWDWFENSVHHISDFTGCIRSKEPIKKKEVVFDAKIKKCKSSKILCKLNKFFEEKKTYFIAIRDYIKGLSDSGKKKPDELNNIISTIEEGLNNPENLCNTSQCKRLGDALIAVEAMHFKELYTKDIDQAKVICIPINLKANLLSD